MSLSVWRIVVGLSLVPAFGTLYQRLTLPESKRYEAAQNMNRDTEDLKETKLTPSASEEDVEGNQLAKKAHFKGNHLFAHMIDDSHVVRIPGIPF